jgi:hypothetical protein
MPNRSLSREMPNQPRFVWCRNNWLNYANPRVTLVHSYDQMQRILVRMRALLARRRIEENCPLVNYGGILACHRQEKERGERSYYYHSVCRVQTKPGLCQSKSRLQVRTSAQYDPGAHQLIESTQICTEHVYRQFLSRRRCNQIPMG